MSVSLIEPELSVQLSVMSLEVSIS